MPRVLHVLSLNVVGGVERLFDGWMSHPAAGAFEQSVLSLRRELHPRFAATLRARETPVLAANHWAGLRLPRRPAWLRSARLNRLLAQAHPDAALLWNALGDGERLELLRRRGIARCYYEHGAALMRRAGDPAGRELAHLDGILCGCHASRRIIEIRFGVPAGRTRVVLNPVVGAAVSPPEEVLPPPATRPLRLGFAGRLTPLKGLPLALHAMRRILDAGTDCEMRIAGTGADLAAMQRLAESLRLGGKARFLGVVQDMPGFYREIDILLCPSLRETMPLVCVEAACAGRPAIAAAINGVPEIVLDGKTGYAIAPRLPLSDYARFGGVSLEGVGPEYYDPASDTLRPSALVSPDDLAEKALALRRNPEEYVRLGRAAALRARELFDMNRYAAAFSGVLREFCDTPGR